MSFNVTVAEKSGALSTTYVSYTPREVLTPAGIMRKSRKKTLYAIAACFVLGFILWTRYSAQLSEIAMNSAKSEHKSAKKSASSSSTGKPSVSMKYAKFFEGKEITKNGIFPLPERRKMVPERPANSDIPLRFYKSKPGSNPHDYEYLLNPFDVCASEEEVFLLVMIASASWEFERRKLIRETWASQQAQGQAIKYVFFVGNDNKPKNRFKLEEEFKEFNDLVLEDFDETYRNLTLKTIGQVKWGTHFCPNARFALHIDDDVFGQINDIASYLSGIKASRYLGCSKVFHPIVRREGKWDMSREDYPGDQYPLGCVGWCFAMSRDVMNELYYMALDTPLIHLEDVSTTGILREKIGITGVTKMPGDEKWCQHLGWPKDKPVEQKLLESWQSYSKV